jgi:hypothetical protein
MIISNKGLNFSTGVDLKFLVDNIEKNHKHIIEEFISFGQSTLREIMNTNKPVVSVCSGFALGGGFELLLNSHKVFAHVETYAGAVEGRLGLIPGFGGTVLILLRTLLRPKRALERTIEIIVSGLTYKSAEYLGYFIDDLDIIPNRTMVLNKAYDWIKSNHGSNNNIKKKELNIPKFELSEEELQINLKDKYQLNLCGIKLISKLYKAFDMISDQKINIDDLFKLEHNLFMQQIFDKDIYGNNTTLDAIKEKLR